MNDKMRDLSVCVMLLLSAHVISELPCLRCSSQMLSGDSFPVRDEPAISWLLSALDFFISSSMCWSGFTSGLVIPPLTYTRTAHKMLEAQISFRPVCVPISFQLFPPTRVSNFLSHYLFIFPSVILTVVGSLIQQRHRAKKNVWSLLF